MNTSARSKNFCEKEKEKLFSLVLKYNYVLENKKSDSITNQKKSDIWGKIETEFNSTSEIKRNAKQLQALYKNSKSKLKKEIAAEKVSAFKTGGGPREKIVHENNPLLSIVQKKVCPINNEYDSSAEYFTTSQDIFENAVEYGDNGTADDNNANNTDAYNNNTSNSNAGESINNNDSVQTPSTSQPETTRKKRARNDDIRLFVEEFSELKKQKILSDIETNKKKMQVYEKKMQVLEALHNDIRNHSSQNNEKENCN